MYKIFHYAYFFQVSLLSIIFQIEGSNPTVCWEEIYRRMQKNTTIVSHTAVVDKLQKSGSYMFGFTHSRISQLIQVTTDYMIPIFLVKLNISLEIKEGAGHSPKLQDK